jgi:MFS family permease
MAKKSKLILMPTCYGLDDLEAQIEAAYFIDRVNLAAAAPAMQQDLGLSNLALGVAFSAFNYSYAPFQLVGGWFADRFGARRTLTVCGMAWSLTTIATGAVTGLVSLFSVRLVLGMGEGATLPAATRAVSKWTPIGEAGHRDRGDPRRRAPSARERRRRSSPF